MQALAHVIDPELHKDLVTLNMARDVVVNGNEVSLRIVLTTPACPLKGKIQSDVESALRPLGATKVNIRWDSQVPTDNRISGALNIGVKSAIAISSGKGGVGKSTVAVNLAVALQRSGAKVGLLDADIYGPNIPIMMGAKGRPMSPDGKHIVPIEAHGVRIMSMGFLVDPDKPVVLRGPMLHGIIRQFLGDVMWGDLDYLFVDLPPGTGDAQLSLSQSIPLTGAVMVTTPQDVSVADVTKALGMFNQVDVPILGLVENMGAFIAPDTGKRYDIFGAGGGRKLAERAGVPFLGEIPLDPQVRVGGDAGIPIVISHPNSPAAKALVDIANALAASISVRILAPEQRFAASPELKIL
ncbi:MAG: Mrp/NBP35 family ATP-binding protein [Chloroflexi bacterium]|nr:Mrp/NBP35 family ATP-binding protein [Chloroflexota bacterium]